MTSSNCNPVEKITRHITLSRLLLLAALLLVAVIRYVPGAGEWYAISFYPCSSASLSWLSSWVPFSLDECVALAGIVWLIWTLVRGIRRSWRWYQTTVRMGLICLTYVVWFYLGWGCNYFRDDFYQRMHVTPAQADATEFMAFAQSFADSINANFEQVCPDGSNSTYELDSESVICEVKAIYQAVPSASGLCRPLDHQQPKTMLINGLYSASGVLGFMGPWMGESLLNALLRPTQYPFTYAHELSHLLGISSEAEANYWAFVVCRQSQSPFVRYSGYLGLLYHVMVNARLLLSDDEYRQWVSTIHPQILEQQRETSLFWLSQRIHWIDEAQNVLLDLQLKSNRIPSGKQNYSQVVQMLMSLPPVSL